MEERVEIAGMWELGWDAPLTETTRWEMMLREFNIDHLNMTPISGIATPWGDKPWIKEYSSINNLLEDHKDMNWVFVEENAETKLSEFIHPDNVLYIFGRANYSPFSNMTKNYTSVKIETPNPGCLWAHQACAIVLYDRSNKR